MRFNLVILLLTLAISACTSRHESASEITTIRNDGEDTDNRLSESQIKDGWINLFDGKSLQGWRFFKDLENNSWEALEGTLHCKPFVDDGENQRSDLVTEKMYDNFELSFDWKISAQGNSGVMFRVSEEFDQPYATGPEYQIIDNEGYPGDLPDIQLTGANYGMYAPQVNEIKKAGEWNTSKIIARGKHIEHWLNGTLILQYEIGNTSWNTLQATTKWKDFPAYGTTSTGHIDLQDHGNEVWFKNIFIRKL